MEAVNHQGLSGEALLHSLPPLNTPVISPELAKLYRKDSKHQPDRERDSKIVDLAQAFLEKVSSLSPQNPNQPSFEEVSRGFGFQSTIYDKIQGETVNTWKEKFAEILLARLYEFKHLELMTHPSILESRLEMLKQGSTGRIPRHFQMMEEIIERNVAIAWKNLGWAINERDYQRDLEDSTTTAIRAEGMWSFLNHRDNNPLVANMVLGPSHPDLVSALSLAELALAGSVVFVPCDGTQSSVEAQKIMLKTAYELIDQHPILVEHKYKDYQLSNGETVSKHLQREAKKRIGITLKPYPVQKSIDIADDFQNTFGVEIFRCFDPRDTQELPKVIYGINKLCPSAHLVASQVTGVASARACADSGALSIIMNIGDGGHCKTASGSGMTTSNPANFYRVQKLVSPKVGIILDGGVGPMALPYAMGAAGCMKHGSLLQGTLQQTPCLNAVLSNGDLYKIYSGEAAERNKFLGGQLDVAGLPKNVEGVDGAIKLSFYSADIPSLSAIITLDRLLEPVAKTIAFLQAKSLRDLASWTQPTCMLPTDEAVETAAPHIRVYP